MNPPPSPRPERPDRDARDPRGVDAVGNAGASDALDALSPVEFDALRWSVRAADGLDAAARQALDAWLAESDAHRAAWADVGGVWSTLEEIPPAGHARLRSVVAIGRAAESSARDTRVLTDEAPAERPPTRVHPSPVTPPTRRRSRFASLSLAAVAVLVAATGWNVWHRAQTAPTYAQHFETRRGQQLEIDLPDGTRLGLDAATQADVALFRQRREVRLPEGQAVFHVASDADRPFDVLAGATRITVVGTRFSVRYTPSLGDRAVQVAVTEGRVRVARADAGPADRTVLLTAGQTVAADATGQPGAVSAVDPAAVAAWQQQRLTFQNTTLAAAVAELSRYGIDRIRIEDPAVGRLPVTASVDLRHVADFLAGLPKVLPVRVERDGATAVIVAAKR